MSEVKGTEGQQKPTFVERAPAPVSELVRRGGGTAADEPRTFPIPPLDVGLIYRCDPGRHDALNAETLQQIIGRNPRDKKETEELLKFAREAADPSNPAAYPLAWVRAKSFAQAAMSALQQRMDRPWEFKSDAEKAAPYYPDTSRLVDLNREHESFDWYGVRAVPYQTEGGMVEMPASPELAQYLVRNYGTAGTGAMISELLCYHENPFFDPKGTMGRHQLAAAGSMLTAGLQAAFRPDRIPLQISGEIAQKTSASLQDPVELTREQFLKQDTDGELFELFVDDAGAPILFSKDEMKVILGIMSKLNEFDNEGKKVDLPWLKVRPLKVEADAISPCAPGGKPVSISKSEEPKQVDEKFVVAECAVGGARDWRYWAAKPSTLNHDQWVAVRSALSNLFAKEGNLQRLQLMSRALERMGRLTTSGMEFQSFQEAVRYRIHLPEDPVPVLERSDTTPEHAFVIKENFPRLLEVFSEEEVQRALAGGVDTYFDLVKRGIEKGNADGERLLKVVSETAAESITKNGEDYINMVESVPVEVVTYVAMRLGNKAFGESGWLGSDIGEKPHIILVSEKNESSYSLIVRKEPALYDQVEMFVNKIKDSLRPAPQGMPSDYQTATNMAMPIAMARQEKMQQDSTDSFYWISIMGVLAGGLLHAVLPQFMDWYKSRTNPIKKYGEDLRAESRSSKGIDVNMRYVEILEFARHVNRGTWPLLLGITGEGKSQILHGLAWVIEKAASGQLQDIPGGPLRKIAEELAQKNLMPIALDGSAIKEAGRWFGGSEGAIKHIYRDIKARNAGAPIAGVRIRDMAVFQRAPLSWVAPLVGAVTFVTGINHAYQMLLQRFAPEGINLKSTLLYVPIFDEIHLLTAGIAGSENAANDAQRITGAIKAAAEFMDRATGTLSKVLTGGATTPSEWVNGIHNVDPAFAGRFGGRVLMRLTKPWMVKSMLVNGVAQGRYGRGLSVEESAIDAVVRLAMVQRQRMASNVKFWDRFLSGVSRVAGEEVMPQFVDWAQEQKVALDGNAVEEFAKSKGWVVPSAAEIPIQMPEFSEEYYEKLARSGDGSLTGEEAMYRERMAELGWYDRWHSANARGKSTVVIPYPDFETGVPDVELPSEEARSAGEVPDLSHLSSADRAALAEALRRADTSPTDPAARAAEAARAGASSLILPDADAVDRFGGRGGGGHGGGRGSLGHRAATEALRADAPLLDGAAHVRSRVEQKAKRGRR